LTSEYRVNITSLEVSDSTLLRFNEEFDGLLSVNEGNRKGEVSEVIPPPTLFCSSIMTSDYIYIKERDLSFNRSLFRLIGYVYIDFMNAGSKVRVKDLFKLISMKVII
tara:strand:- start:355 stop:678 length:324 start_codon:yes stop_codon:yes gene_type:complete